jgi:hypothetical protein
MVPQDDEDLVVRVIEDLVAEVRSTEGRRGKVAT